MSGHDEPIVYACRCGWEGTDPAFDAHLNAFCPTCGRAVEFKAVLELLQDEAED